jgi:2-aminoadipate transaminase
MTEVPQPPHKRRAHTSTRDLERYAGLFAERTTVMRSSAMRDLMAVTARPEVISLAGGLPDTSTFPPESLAAQMSKIAAESAAAALQYGPTEGFDETKDCIVEVMAAEGMLPDPDDIVITTGGQQAIDLVTKTLVDPGDVVICEAPTYPGAVPVFCSYQADVRQIEMDGDGMRVDLLEALLEELRAEGLRPKFIYTVPSFQNPGGVTLSLARRARLVELARLHEILVVEDNPYGMLRYEGEPLPPLYQLDGGDFVVYLGTFSKILSPGIRLGWVVAPPPVLEKVVLGKGATDLCSSSSASTSPKGAGSATSPTWSSSTGGAATRCSRPWPSTSRPRRPGPSPPAASSSGRRCPTTSTPATCWRRPCGRTSPSCPARRPTSTGAARARCA